MSEQKHHVPALRFPEFSGEWKEQRLGDMCTFTSSKRIHVSDYVSSGIPFFRGKEITELRNRALPSDVLFIDRNKFQALRKKYGAPKAGDILITAVGTLGNVYAVREGDEFYFKDGNLIWLQNIKENTSYCEALISYNKPAIIKTSIGSTQKALTMVELKKLTFAFPTLPEQEKIAAFLGVVDARVEQLRRKQALLEQYKKGVMQRIFSQEIRFTDDHGNPFPDWQEKRLGDIALKQSSTLAANSIAENIGNYPVYGAAGIVGKINTFMESETYISIVKDGAGVGRLFLCEAKTSVLGTLDIVKARDKNNIIYLYHLMSLINFSEYTTGSTIPHIYFKDYAQKLVMLPHPDEQSKIADFLSAIDSKIDSVTKEVEAAQNYKKSLLQQMFV